MSTKTPSMANLQQLLIDNPPTTPGVHEAMAQYAERIFEELNGILPLFLGKKHLGSYINLTLPNDAVQSSATLVETLGDLILVYNLRLASFVTSVRTQTNVDSESKLGALLITADHTKSILQLPWSLEFDADSKLAQHSRSETQGDVIPADVWGSLFSREANLATKAESYARLVERFGGEDQLPKP